MTHRSRLCHFVIDVDDLDAGVAFWSAALDANEEPLPRQPPGLPPAPPTRLRDPHPAPAHRRPERPPRSACTSTSKPTTSKPKSTPRSPRRHTLGPPTRTRLRLLGPPRPLGQRVLRPPGQLPRPPRPAPTLAQPRDGPTTVAETNLLLIIKAGASRRCRHSACPRFAADRSAAAKPSQATAGRMVWLIKILGSRPPASGSLVTTTTRSSSRTTYVKLPAAASPEIGAAAFGPDPPKPAIAIRDVWRRASRGGRRGHASPRPG